MIKFNESKHRFEFTDLPFDYVYEQDTAYKESIALEYTIEPILEKEVSKLLKVLVFQVLQQLLHREPTDEDARLVEFVSSSQDTNYKTLAYDGLVLGLVIIDYKQGVSFQPSEMFK